MKYYAIINNKSKLIAYHEERRVVTRYLDAYNRQYREKDPEHNEEYKIVKMKSKVLKLNPHYENLYLVRYGRMFIQSGYYQYVEDDIRTFMSELYLTKDTLSKIFELDDLDPKEEKSIRRTLAYISSKIMDEEEAIYPLHQLERIKSSYEDFRDSLSCQEEDDWRWTN